MDDPPEQSPPRLPDRFDEQEPGPQQSLRRFDLAGGMYRLAFFLFFVIIFYSVIRAQLTAEFINNNPFWQFAFFDASDALMVLVALVALLYTRYEFMHNTYPLLVYEGQTHAEGGSLADVGRTFSITLKNAGNGTCNVVDVHYHIQFDGETKLNLTHEEAVDQLKSKGLEIGRNIMLRKISAGYALASNAELLIFECAVSDWGVLEHLDCTVDCRGISRDLLRKEVFLIPRDRASRF